MAEMKKNKIALWVILAVVIGAFGFIAFRAFASEYSQGYEITVHYYNSTHWNSPYIYYYTNGYQGPSWPGAPMVNDGDGWYSYTIRDYTSMKVIFSDNGTNQNPGAGQEGYEVNDECWYCNGIWYDTEPVKTTVHYYNQDNWSVVSLYYYSTNFNPVSWPGEVMEHESGKWYKKDLWGESNQRVIFSANGANQNPGAGQPGYEVTGEKWYKDGQWYDEKPLDVIVHFYKPDGWSAPDIYYYISNSDTGPAWPGTAMTNEGDGWYEYHIQGYCAARVLFNDGSSQIPAAGQEGFLVSGAMWYKNGEWYRYKPQSHTETLVGDLNGDGVVDGYDRDLLSDYINNLVVIDLQGVDNADVNGDGVVDNNDLQLMQDYLDGEIEDFPRNEGTNISHDYIYEYDALNRIVKKIIDEDNYIEYAYDANGNMTGVNVVGDIQ